MEITLHQSTLMRKSEITPYIKLKAALFTLIIIGFWGCSGSSDVVIPEEIASLENLTLFDSETEPAGEIQLHRETSFGDTDDVFLGAWLMTHVDDRGRVFIADNSETVLHLYNPDGSYNRQIGREGDGPGEYRNIGSLQTDENYLHLYDRNVNRITRYDIDTFEVLGDVNIEYDRDADGGFFRSIRSIDLLDDQYYMTNFGTGFRAGNPDIDQSKRKMTGEKMDRISGEFVDHQIYSFRDSEALVEFRGDGSMSVMSVPYKRSSVVQLSNNGIVYGWTEHFLFQFYDRDGNYRHAVYYDHKNHPLNRNEILEMYADRGDPWRSMVRNDQMPESWPSWSNFHVDDEDRIWVQRITDDRDLHELNILSETGELLAVLPWESGNRIQTIKNGHLYSIEENEDGLMEVVKYRIDRF